MTPVIPIKQPRRSVASQSKLQAIRCRVAVENDALALIERHHRVKEVVEGGVAGSDLADGEIGTLRLYLERFIRDRRAERLDFRRDTGAGVEWMGSVFCTHELACFLAAQILVRTLNVHGPFSRRSADFVGFLSERRAKNMIGKLPFYH
jgi:hypothetical protein